MTDELLWGIILRENGHPLILELLESLSVLFFKPGYTVDNSHRGTHKIRKSLTGRYFFHLLTQESMKC